MPEVPLPGNSRCIPFSKDSRRTTPIFSHFLLLNDTYVIDTRRSVLAVSPWHPRVPVGSLRISRTPAGQTPPAVAKARSLNGVAALQKPLSKNYWSINHWSIKPGPFSANALFYDRLGKVPSRQMRKFKPRKGFCTETSDVPVEPIESAAIARFAFAFGAA